MDALVRIDATRRTYLSLVVISYFFSKGLEASSSEPLHGRYV